MVTPLILWPILFIAKYQDDDRMILATIEIFFVEESMVLEFDKALRACDDAQPSGPEMSRIYLLKHNIIWELVDGQDMVAACEEAGLNWEAKILSHAEEKYNFLHRHTTFVVYNKSYFYIEVSIKINASKFENGYYTSLIDDIQKLHNLFIATCDDWMHVFMQMTNYYCAYL